MNDPIKSLILPLHLSKDRLSVLLTYHNIFRQLRPVRIKYQLSSNTVIVLNGVYLYSMLVKTEFTYRGIRDFVRYFNKGKIEYYLNQLIDKGYIKEHRRTDKVVYYRLNESGYNLINEIFNDFDVIYSQFLKRYDISI